jgi:hypothetical protein
MPIIENKFIDNCESALYPAYKFFHGVPALTYFSGCIIAYGSLDKNTMGSILIAWMAGHICSGLYSFIGKKISPPEERQERWQAKQQQDRSEELSAVMEKMRDAPREELEAAIKKVFPECKVVIEEAADDVVNDAGTVHHSKRIVKIVG